MPERSNSHDAHQMSIGAVHLGCGFEAPNAQAPSARAGYTWVAAGENGIIRSRFGVKRNRRYITAEDVFPPRDLPHRPQG